MALLFSVMLDSLKEVIWMNGILNQAKAIRSLCESHFERIKEKHALVVFTWLCFRSRSVCDVLLSPISKKPLITFVEASSCDKFRIMEHSLRFMEIAQDCP